MKLMKLIAFDEGERIPNFAWYPVHILDVLHIPGGILELA